MITSFNITAKDACKYGTSKVNITVKIMPTGLTESEHDKSCRDFENRLFKLLMEDTNARNINISKRVSKLR